MMIKLGVFKNIYYNTKSAERDLELKAPVQIRYLAHKQNVDINEFSIDLIRSFLSFSL